MRFVVCLVVYTALAGLANAGDYTQLMDMREGEMRKLQFHDAPVPPVDAAFIDHNGDELTLSQWRGKYILLNFWATWCAPCRHEMPMLEELQTQLGGDDFEVVTIATGRNHPDGMRAFFAEIGVENLPLLRDPKQALAREMAVLGLPVTVILDPEGQEIARMVGPADWSGPNARNLINAMVTLGAAG